jgi:DNA-directed RNA polymerase specialized sigma24 family protein
MRALPMTAEQLNPGDNGALSRESASDLIGEFVRAEYAKVVEAVALATGLRDEAEDAVQVALLRFLTHAPRPSCPGLQVTVLAASLISRRPRTFEGMRGWARRVLLPRRQLPEAVEAGAFEQTLSELPQGQRLVSLLYYYLDYPVADIADALRVPRIAVRARLHLATSKMETLLGGAPGL